MTMIGIRRTMRRRWTGLIVLGRPSRSRCIDSLREPFGPNYRRRALTLASRGTIEERIVKLARAKKDVSGLTLHSY